MSVPVARRGWVIAVPLLAACGGYEAAAPLLSASRLALVEGEVARVEVDVPTADDFELGPSTPSWIRPIGDGTSVGFTVEPGCDVARGAAHEEIVEVVDRRSGRAGALVVTVDDSVAPSCVAEVTLWLGRGACDAPPTATPARLEAIDRGSADRLCLRTRPADPAGRPITAVELRLEPDTLAFAPPVVEPAAADGTRLAWRAAGAGRIPDWLVGELDAGYRLTAGEGELALSLEASRALVVGRPGEVGLELGAPGGDAPSAFVAREFERAVVPVTVHRFAETATVLVAEPDRAAATAAPICVPTPAVRLYRLADDLAIASCERHVLAAGGDPHARFRLAYVPGIDAAAHVIIPLALPDLAPPARREVALDVTSRADEVAFGAPLRDLACAHLAGAPTVIATTDGGTRLWPLPGWRRAGGAALAVAGTITGPPVVVPTANGADVVAARGDTLVQLTDAGGAWAWTDALTVRGLPRELVPLRGPTATAPDWLAGVVRAGGQVLVRLVRRSDGASPAPFTLLVDDRPGEYSLAVVDVGAAGDELVLVAPAAPLAGDHPEAHVYSLRWSGGLPDGVLEAGVVVHQGVLDGARRSVGARTDGAGGAELWVAVGDGPISYGVAAFTIGADGTIVAGGAEGGRSAATAPDGSVLVAGEIGVLQRPAGTGAPRQIDPARRETGLDYGARVAPCVLAAGALRGFVVETTASDARAGAHDIVVETP